MTDHHSEHLFRLQQLGLTRRARPVLRGIDWQWQPGEQWAVLGPNGAGKTALASVLAGESVHFSGSYERGAKLREKGTAYVCFERARSLCERDRKLDCAEFESTGEDIGTPVKSLLPASSPAALRRELIDLLDLESLLERGLRYLSTGEMRKVLLASALLSEPALMILDSPLDGLDRGMQQQLGATLDPIIRDSIATLVMARSAADIPAACSHVLLLGEGRVQAQGRREEVLGSRACAELMAPPALSLGAMPRSAVTASTDLDPTFTLRGVRVDYGELCVFQNLDWNFRRQQHCLISGPNGCGKSTLLDLLTGDNHKAYGQDITLFGRPRGSGESVWEIKRRFGRVDARMQFTIPSDSSVLDTVCSGFFDSLGLYDRPSDRQRGAAREWLAALGLTAFADDEFQTLSFGLQRLALLARAMVKAPDILLLDEATLSLDAGHRRLLLEALDHVVENSGSQLLFVSHSAGEIPRCINQTLTFTPGPRGSSISVRDSAPA
jgi:molybdate transport system ATP-binding protein